MSYLDFELEIGPAEGGEYPVAVLHSPAGEVRAKMRFPFDGPTLTSPSFRGSSCTTTARTSTSRYVAEHPSFGTSSSRSRSSR